MSLGLLLTTNTFRDWFNLTNNLVSVMLDSTLTDGVVANGIFTANGSLSVVGSFFANASFLNLRSNTTISANVTANSQCNVFNFACGSLLIQPLNGTIVNTALTVNGTAVFLQGLTSNANVTISGDITQTGNTAHTGTLSIIGGPINARQVLFASANAVVTPANLANPEYDDFTVSGLTEAEVINLTPDIDTVLTGIAAPSNVANGARILYVQNIAVGHNVTVVSANTNSSVNNRFNLPGGTAVIITPGCALGFIWTTTNREWRALMPQQAATPNTFASLTVSGLATLSGNVVVGGWLNVAHQLVVTGNTALTGNVDMSGYANIATTLQVTGVSTLTGNATLSGFANVAGALSVAGLSILTGNATLSGFANIAGSLNVSGLVTLTGNATLSGFANIAGKLVVAGNASIAGLASITGNATLLGDCSITGNVNLGLVVSASYPLVNKVANYTATINDDVITCNGTFTVTAYTAVGNTGRKLTIKNTNTGVVTANTTSSQTIDGATTYPLTQQYQSVTLASDGANWSVI